MKRISYEESVRLTQEILRQPLGNWTHMIDGKPVRVVERCIVGRHEYEIVFFRADDYCGRWIAEQFDKRAKPYVPEPEQMTLW